MPDTNPAQPATKQVVTYNPNEIINIFADSLARRSTGVINVRGIYHPGRGGNYYGYYYDILKDEFTQYELTIKIPAVLREGLEEGNLVDLKGTIDRKVNNSCTVQLTLNVTGVVVVQEQTISEDELKRIEIRKAKVASGFKNVDVILENAIFADRRPSVGLIFADSSITDSDFNAGKDAASVQIDFREYRVSFARPKEFVQTLRSVDSYGHDVICIVRGGGSGLEALENLDVLSCVAEMTTAVVTAVGHVEDNVFIEDVADKKLGTPSLLGQYFKDLVERVAKKKADSTAALTRKIEAQFKERIETTNKQNAELQKKFDELSKNSAEATRKHDEQVKAAQAQNKKLQEMLDAVAKGNGAAQKKYNEQVEELTKKIGDMQKNVTTLTEANAKTGRELIEANRKNGDLQAQLAAARNKGGSKWVIALLAAIIVVLVLIIVLR